LTAKLFSFWSGSPLSYVEQLCLASMLQAGHPIDVFTYDQDLSVPTGVTVRSAAEIIPLAKVVRHKSGSMALFSDIFRYEALRAGMGIWIDLDVLLLRSLSDMGEHVFGWQDPYVINGAVLRLPPDSECLGRLIDLCRSPVVIGPHWPRHRKLLQRARSLVGTHVPIQQLEWGAVGPMALTHFVTSCRLLHHCQPVDVFYPVHFKDAACVFTADASAVAALFTSSTRAVHLWNNMLKELKHLPPPPTSFIAKMCERFGVRAE
jgi:hypothetical protein